MATIAACAGFTKSGSPCQKRPGSTGYCPTHDPATSTKLEQERQARERERQAAQARCKSLQEILDSMQATCKGKGWKSFIQHFDRQAGQYATLGVERYFSTRNGYDSETVTAIIETVYHQGRGVRAGLQSSSSIRYKYSLEDLMDAINTDLERNIPWLGERPNKQTQQSPESAVQKLEHLLRRFHRIAHQLTQRHGGRQTLIIQDEYDVQDLLHAQLLALFDDVRPEDPAPTHAGKASRLDFFLKLEKIMVEVKMTRETLRDDKVGEQLIIDIERYRARSECSALVCFVYDPGRYLKNPRSLENDLSRKYDHLTVKVIVYSP